jgi:hypothetical protein
MIAADHCTLLHAGAQPARVLMMLLLSLPWQSRSAPARRSSYHIPRSGVLGIGTPLRNSRAQRRGSQLSAVAPHSDRQPPELGHLHLSQRVGKRVELRRFVPGACRVFMERGAAVKPARRHALQLALYLDCVETLPIFAGQVIARTARHCTSNWRPLCSNCATRGGGKVGSRSTKLADWHRLPSTRFRFPYLSRHQPATYQASKSASRRYCVGRQRLRFRASALKRGKSRVFGGGGGPAGHTQGVGMETGPKKIANGGNR